jgi:hypothetical protein
LREEEEIGNLILKLKGKLRNLKRDLKSLEWDWIEIS